MIYGLTPIGWLHTLLSLVALACAVAAIARDRRIRSDRRVGQAYLVLTALTALTAFAIFRRGEFGPGHVIAALTLLAIGSGLLLERGAAAGSWRGVTAALLFSATILFHLIPGATETLTRFPPGKPIATSPEELRGLFLTLLAGFLVLATIQARTLRKAVSA